MPDIKADKIGLETGTYHLPCGCRIFVKFPGGHIHFEHGGAKCPELSALWSAYWASCRNGHSWTSLNNYLACLRHVGAWTGRLGTIAHERDRYPNPADSLDHPTDPAASEEDPHGLV
ncbi:hypothetical protein AB5J52_48055 (plasmid) [Streptomyces sp. R39]|uniref:Uncharacterized protein n=1 Tax=Streptomyces sp. R39 TaxID=3238631 RepID=A0AB39R4S7_9ACTN